MQLAKPTHDINILRHNLPSTRNSFGTFSDFQVTTDDSFTKYFAMIKGVLCSQSPITVSSTLPTQLWSLLLAHILGFGHHSTSDTIFYWSANPELMFHSKTLQNLMAYNNKLWIFAHGSAEQLHARFQLEAAGWVQACFMCFYIFLERQLLRLSLLSQTIQACLRPLFKSCLLIFCLSNEVPWAKPNINEMQNYTPLILVHCKVIWLNEAGEDWRKRIQSTSVYLSSITTYHVFIFFPM